MPTNNKQGDAPQIDVIDGKRKIVVFMNVPKCDRCDDDCGHYKFGSGIYYHPIEMQYHTSWDWLMPVVEKIESLDFISYLGDGDSISYKVIVEIAKNYCKIEPNTSMILPLGIKSYKPEKIDSAFAAIVQFIEWYNQLNQQ